jgi:hypothetical protein
MDAETIRAIGEILIRLAIVIAPVLICYFCTRD